MIDLSHYMSIKVLTLSLSFYGYHNLNLLINVKYCSLLRKESIIVGDLSIQQNQWVY